MSTDILYSIVNRYSGAERSLIEHAFELAKQAHTGQKRASGEEYISHPVAVANYCAELGMDAATIAAALLHDTVEDTPVTLEHIQKQFGAEIAALVDGVTKLEAVQYLNSTHDRKNHDVHIESLKKMFFAMAEDIRVILIKLADRFHNMETLRYKNREAQERIAHETLEIYAPIAARLGMGYMKGQLEDLAFPYAYPVEHRALLKQVKDTYADRLRYIERTKPVITRHLRDADVSVVNVHSRAKHYWSLYQKMQRYDTQDPDRVTDLVAVRIVVPDIKSCYETLGVIHKHYRPLPGRIKDYIALPKPNGYRSIHTTVFCERGRIVEMQIRTPEMHDHAENGIAAHWAYSESGKRKPIIAKQQETTWIRQLRDFLKDLKSKEGLKSIKIDFFKNRIFAFTPKGDIKDLPEGATPIDFAYTIHSDLGHATAGAKVNGKMVSLDSTLQNGDVVDIVKSKTTHPSLDWLRSVKTAEAKKRIRTWLVAHTPVSAKEEAVDTKVIKNKVISRRTQSNLYAEKFGIQIEGQRGLLYKLGKCCSPKASQNVQGYITRAKGVTVHLTSCKNIKSADHQRLLKAEWN